MALFGYGVIAHITLAFLLSSCYLVYDASAPDFAFFWAEKEKFLSVAHLHHRISLLERQIRDHEREISELSQKRYRTEDALGEQGKRFSEFQSSIQKMSNQKAKVYQEVSLRLAEGFAEKVGQYSSGYHFGVANDGFLQMEATLNKNLKELSDEIQKHNAKIQNCQNEILQLRLQITAQLAGGGA